MDCLGNLVVVSFERNFLGVYEMILMREMADGVLRNPKGPLRAPKAIREGPKGLSVPQLVNLPIQ